MIPLCSRAGGARLNPSQNGSSARVRKLSIRLNDISISSGWTAHRSNTVMKV